jgi:hypothetical protein
MLIRHQHDTFISAKCTAPLRARHPALRAALVRETLDPATRRISHLASTTVAAAPVDLDAVVIERIDGLHYLDVVTARPVRSLDQERTFRSALQAHGVATRVVTAADLAAEPGRTNRDLVWSHHRRPIPVDLRLQILRLLVDDGPTTLDRLLTGVIGRDPAAAVMALACNDLLELDLESGPLGPQTMVRARG